MLFRASQQVINISLCWAEMFASYARITGRPGKTSIAAGSTSRL